ncbi:MAG: exodeoxyribonuclease V subunit beta [Beggiatoa sp. IS2]|nr:MAG: exodeoxyribonuclease V subunit beta [Beggiatoa sp. IS2]
MNQPLDPFAISLNGIHLIEASAGTGKTYTLTTLFIRLLLEKQLRVDEILVVTFTEAATKELRERIRRRLHEVLRTFEEQTSSDKELCKFLQSYPNHQEIIKLLIEALHNFDESAIFTIHGFCLRVLRDHAFESGVLFDTKLISDQSDFLQEIVGDFWRQHFYQASPLFVNYALENGYDTPDSLLAVLGNGQYLGKSFLKIIPQLDVINVSETTFLDIFAQTQQFWQVNAADIETLLLADTHLNANKYRKTSIPQWCQTLTSYFNQAIPSMNLPEKFEQFTTQKLANSVKKGKTPPQHLFFDLCEKFLTQQQIVENGFYEHLLALKYKLFTVVKNALMLKKQQFNVQSYDDLLLNVGRALSTENLLAQRLYHRYPVALIDEFQDTDPVQYQIFKQIYAHNPTLFFIGDPKQAIYSFRGADIFTYMSAHRHANQQHTLTINHRSEEKLLRAINILFTQVERPFIFADIPYPLATAIPKSQLRLENQQFSPLTIWFVSRAQAELDLNKPIPKKLAEKSIPLAVAYEIARLLTLAQRRQAFIGNRPLTAGDIAILVDTNDRARFMQKTLTSLNIPSVLYSRENLFNSPEIAEIAKILMAVAQPQDESLMKAALATEIVGWTSSDLYEMSNDQKIDTWKKQLYKFQKYHTLWQNIGFMQMFRTLLTEQQVSERLLRYPDGERRLTNVLHAAEILHQAIVHDNLSIDGLNTWLMQQRLQAQTEVDDERQLRLESDDQRIKIITIHKSKGLEYPIVFCPFIWEGRLRTEKSQQFTFHDAEGNVTLDLGSPLQETHRQQALLEELAEKLRLFYVAITRAQYRCYLVWGAFRDAATSALAHLLYSHLNSEFEQADDEILWKTLHTLTLQSDESLQVMLLPTEKTAYQRSFESDMPLRAREFTRIINTEWHVSSFTALTAAAHAEVAERPDYDEWLAIRPTTPVVSARKTIFDFPQGAKAGVFVHAVFEHLDFLQPQQEVIKQQLNRFGYDEAEWLEVLSDFITAVLTTPLDPRQPALNLEQIWREVRLNEWEFYYPLRRITAAGLQTVLAQHHAGFADLTALETSTRLEFAPVRGFMRGFIDMIFQYQGRFYLVDYKSNFLGTTPAAYHRDSLRAVMTRENYFLQYLIYTVALHRYLGTRLPNYRYKQHFGGIFYLFVRGMNPKWGTDYGIYRDLPAANLIAELSDYFSPI